MNVTQIDAACRALRGVRRETRFGPGVHCWTVDGQIFAMIADGAERLSLRCPDESVVELLVQDGRAGKLPYLQSGWIALDLSVEEFVLNCRIIESYEVAREEGA